MSRALAVVASLFLMTSPALAQEDQPPAPSPEDTTAPPPLAAPEQGEDVEPAPAPEPAPRRRVVRRRRAAEPAVGDDGPVVRAKDGNMGMYFRFGGLDDLTHSNNTRNVGAGLGGPLVFTQVGMKFVLSEQMMIPIYFGTGLRLDAPAETDSQTNWGIDLGGGFEYHFRVWRRISPFIGLLGGFNISDPSGDDDLLFGFGVGPNLGVEYYIGDRVSLTAMYMFVLQVEYQDDPNNAVTSFAYSTLAGGAVNITYYF